LGKAKSQSLTFPKKQKTLLQKLADYLLLNNRQATLIGNTEKLQSAGYTVMCTPFGYFNEFLIYVGGESLAKVFKEF
jgi:hypothetical protein